jgi:DNA gyrase/topoisomerase IV subunit B
MTTACCLGWVEDGMFQHVSFTNSISTIKGGSHINYIAWKSSAL